MAKQSRTTNSQGVFEHVRYDTLQELTCRRCAKPKMVRTVVRWTDTAGVTGTICKRCYSHLASRATLEQLRPRHRVSRHLKQVPSRGSERKAARQDRKRAVNGSLTGSGGHRIGPNEFVPSAATPPAQALKWLRSEFPSARFAEADAAIYLAKLRASADPDGRKAAVKIAKRQAREKASRRSRPSGQQPLSRKRRRKRDRNLPTVSGDASRIEPLPPLESMAQNPIPANAPPWRRSAPSATESVEDMPSPGLEPVDPTVTSGTCIHGLERYICRYCRG